MFLLSEGKCWSGCCYFGMFFIDTKNGNIVQMWSIFGVSWDHQISIKWKLIYLSSLSQIWYPQMMTGELSSMFRKWAKKIDLLPLDKVISELITAAARGYWWLMFSLFPNISDKLRVHFHQKPSVLSSVSFFLWHRISTIVQFVAAADKREASYTKQGQRLHRACRAAGNLWPTLCSNRRQGKCEHKGPAVTERMPSLTLHTTFTFTF